MALTRRARRARDTGAPQFDGWPGEAGPTPGRADRPTRVPPDCKRLARTARPVRARRSAPSVEPTVMCCLTRSSRSPAPTRPAVCAARVPIAVSVHFQVPKDEKNNETQCGVRFDGWPGEAGPTPGRADPSTRVAPDGRRLARTARPDQARRSAPPVELTIMSCLTRSSRSRRRARPMRRTCCKSQPASISTYPESKK